MSNKNGDEIEIKTIKFKGQGKYPLKCIWTVIKKGVNNDNVTTVSFDDKIPAVERQEESIRSVRIELIDTDNPFLVARPKEREAIIVGKPSKIDIFVSDLELAKNITDSLNGITSIHWCTDPESIKVSAMIIMGEEEISEKIFLLIEGISPLIETIMEKFYGDEK